MSLHFVIKERKEESVKMRADSILELSKEDSSGSTAMSTLTMIIGELLDKDFKVFGLEHKDDILSNSLNLLKVLHYVSSKIELF